VPFPFTDHPVAKRRPAAVLSSRAFNDENGHAVLAMITTGARSAWPSDIALTDLGTAGVQHPCVVRWKLFTLPNGLILRKLGALATKDRLAVFNGALASGAIASSA
jgi:mRNA interferase MazF